MVQEAYVNGVSTRKVDRLVEQLGVDAMSKEQVSRLCRGLDEQVRRLPRAAAGGPLPVPVAGRQDRAGPGERGGGAPEGAGDRLRGARDGPARGDRPGRRRGRDRGLLARVPARARGPRPGRRAARASPTPTRACKNAIGQVLGAPVAALHRALPARHARPRAQDQQPLVARRDPRSLRRAGSGQQAGEPLAEVVERLRAGAPQGRPAARGRRGRPARLHALPARALAQAAQHQPAGARQPRDRPPLRRRRHLPQRRRPAPARRPAC